MFSMTLEVTKSCNLNCKYCYQGDKSNKNMDKEIALKAIKIGFNEAKKYKDKTLELDFYGGEPLMNVDLIKYCVSKAHELAGNEFKVKFCMTTNMTLITEELVKFFIDENIQLKVSLDGDKNVHDLNRVYYDGKGSYLDVIEKWNLLKEYREKVDFNIQVSHVITKNNYMHYHNSIKHLIELGFVVIDTGIDYTATWTSEEFEVLKEQIEMTVDYVIESYKNKKKIDYLFLQNSVEQNVEEVEFYPCRAGEISNFISYDGYIYPCSEIDNRVCIGHVDTGIDTEKLNKILGICSINNEKCNKCSITNKCACKSCLMLNLSVNNSFDIPIAIQCELRKFMYDLVNRKFYVDKIRELALV